MNWNPYYSSRNTLPGPNLLLQFKFYKNKNKKSKHPKRKRIIKIRSPKIKFKRKKKNRIPAPRFRCVVLCEPELAENSGEIMKDIHGIVPINKFHL